MGLRVRVQWGFGHLRVRVGVRVRVRVRMRVLRALARLCWGKAKADVQAVRVCYLLALPSSSYKGNCQASFVHMICYYILSIAHVHLLYICNKLRI